MKIPALSLTLSAVVLLSACTLGPDYIQPDTVDTSSLRHQDGWQPMPARSWAASGQWWRAFDDATLSALVEQSVQANQTLAQAEARYRAAEAQWRLARGGLSPEVGTSLGGSRSGGSDRSTSTQYDARLQIGWAPDLWGRVRRGIEADQAGLQASAADLAAVRMAIQVAVAEAYINLRALDQQQAILDGVPVPGAPTTGSPDELDCAQDVSPNGVRPCWLANVASTSWPWVRVWPLV